MPYTTPVGTFDANGYGLYDMAGNVREWCWDRYGPYAGGTDPHGPTSGTHRVLRGGGYSDFATELCTASRYFPTLPNTADNTIGFRCVRGL
jgi:formylglycine-generating enzyme required for sulfatase activity